MHAAPITVRAAIGNYPHTRALRSGALSSDLLTFAFADIATINRVFAPMVREARFDVSEMAIATFLQARAYGKELILLPVVLAARHQETALLCRTDSDIAGPSDLVGKRVGVRAYSQTTGMWLRGILAERHGIKPDQIRWITFEDAHLAEYQDPSWTERAPAGSDLLGMLYAGDLDAVIVGNEVPDDPRLRTVFPDPAAAARHFWGAHHFVPVNHLLCVRSALADAHPGLIAELLRLFRAAEEQAELSPSLRRALLFGRAALEPAVQLALRYATAQGLLPHRLEPADIWRGLPADVA